MYNYDFAKLRKEFPLLKERTYLAAHTLGPLPQKAFIDIDAYTQSLYMGRRVFSLWLERYEEMFHLCELLLNAPKDSVAITASTTAAQAALAAAIKPNHNQNRIVTTTLDFSSGRYLWGAQVQRGFDVVEIHSSNRLQIETSDIIAKIDERVAVVAISLVSYINSARLDIKPIITAAHEVGAIVVLDAYQGVGVIPIDVIDLGVDVLVGGTNKWLCGGLGLAFAYVRPSLAAQLNPMYPGWFAHLDPGAFAETYAPAIGARRFQQGAPSFEPIYTSRAGLQFAIDVGVDQIHHRNIELTTYLIECADLHGIPVLTPRDPARRGGTICLEVDRAELVVRELAELGIDVDTRSNSKIRVSPHCCNTEAECRDAIEAIAQIVHNHSVARSS